MPKPAKIYSLTLPTPGSFLTGNCIINLYTSYSLLSKKVIPFGLFISEQILASILFGAIPQLAVI
jgi:hypothetical protein